MPMWAELPDVVRSTAIPGRKWSTVLVVRFTAEARMPPPWPPAVLLLTVLPSRLTVRSAETPPPSPWHVFPLAVLLYGLLVANVCFVARARDYA